MKSSPTEKSFTKFFLHLHPKRIDQRAIKFNRTFGLGGIAALLILILFFTGLLLKFIYVPSAQGAYDSIKLLQEEFIFGQFLRNLHYWSALFLMTVAFLHLIRVFYSVAIFNERRKNWVYGIVLMFFVASSNFTGYLLPWDQLAFWAVTIMTNMLSYIPLIGEGVANALRDGSMVTEKTLLRFYHFHTGLLPILLIFFMSIHFWLVRKARGVALPTIPDPQRVDTHPHLVYRELLVATIVLLVLFLFSFFADAPLLDKAKPMVSPNPAKAPWYFMGFQELLIHVHPLFGTLLIPLSVVTFLISIPFLKTGETNTGVWFNSARGKKATIITAIFTATFTFSFIVIIEKFLNFNKLLASWPQIISTGVVPTLLMSAPIVLFLYILKKKLELNRIETIMATVTTIITAYIIMMITGTLLRGEGMHLIF